MLQNYLPIYQIAMRLQQLRSTVGVFRDTKVSSSDTENLMALLEEIQSVCLDHGLTHTSDLAKRAIGKPLKVQGEVFSLLDFLNESLTNELEKEAIFRIPPARKDYFERNDLFGPEVAAAFPSCARDIEKAGSCYALEQEDACVHHLMLVLERGLHALAGRVGVSYQRANWQIIIDQISVRLQSLLQPPERDFYKQVNAQFGFLKDAYRNHSQHAHDDPYDMVKALHILNHVRDFMQALVKGGISE